MRKYGSGKTGVGSFYTHKMVIPGGVAGLGLPAYRVPRRFNEDVPRPGDVGRPMGKYYRKCVPGTTKRLIAKVTVESK